MFVVIITVVLVNDPWMRRRRSPKLYERKGSYGEQLAKIGKRSLRRDHCMVHNLHYTGILGRIAARTLITQLEENQ